MKKWIIQIQKWKYDALLIAITIIWGSTFLVVQNTVKMVGPFSFLTLRFGIAALALAIIFRKRLARITRKEIMAGSLIGLFLFAGYTFQTTGLQYTTSSKAAFITGLYVPFVPVLAIMVLRQWPTVNAVLGVWLSLLGLVLLSVNDKFNLEIGTGELLVLGCAVAFALHIVAISKYAPKMDAINLTIVQIALTALLSAISAPIAGEPFEMPGLEVWGSALFMGVVATAFCLAVMNRVQQFVSSTRATLFYALEPVWAGIFGYIVGEELSIAAWIGCALIFAGMIVGELKIRFPRERSIPADLPSTPVEAS